MKDDFAGWIAFYSGKKLEIPKENATNIGEAKEIAITHFKVPKSKRGLLAIEPAYEE
jgi:hypothetical protein